MSCLFDSLSVFLKLDSNSIRQEICNYLESNKKIMDGLDTNFILSLENPNYIRNMRMSHVWGGAIEIQAACNIFNIKIIVHNQRNNENTQIEFLPIDGEYRMTIHLSWTGGHYTPITYK